MLSPPAAGAWRLRLAAVLDYGAWSQLSICFALSLLSKTSLSYRFSLFSAPESSFSPYWTLKKSQVFGSGPCMFQEKVLNSRLRNVLSLLKKVPKFTLNIFLFLLKALLAVPSSGNGSSSGTNV